MRNVMIMVILPMMVVYVDSYDSSWGGDDDGDGDGGSKDEGNEGNKTLWIIQPFV